MIDEQKAEKEEETNNQVLAQANSSRPHSEISNAVSPTIECLLKSADDNAVGAFSSSPSTSLPTEPNTEAMEVDETDESVKEEKETEKDDQLSTTSEDNDNIALESGNSLILVEEGQNKPVSVQVKFDNATAVTNCTIFLFYQAIADQSDQPSTHEKARDANLVILERLTNCPEQSLPKSSQKRSLSPPASPIELPEGDAPKKAKTIAENGNEDCDQANSMVTLVTSALSSEMESSGNTLAESSQSQVQSSLSPVEHASQASSPESTTSDAEDNNSSIEAVPSPVASGSECNTLMAPTASKQSLQQSSEQQSTDEEIEEENGDEKMDFEDKGKDDNDNEDDSDGDDHGKNQEECQNFCQTNFDNQKDKEENDVKENETSMSESTDDDNNSNIEAASTPSASDLVVSPLQTASVSQPSSPQSTQQSSEQQSTDEDQKEDDVEFSKKDKKKDVENLDDSNGDDDDNDGDDDDQDGNQGGCQSSDAIEDNHSNIDDAVTPASDSELSPASVSKPSSPTASQPSSEQQSHHSTDEEIEDGEKTFDDEKMDCGDNGKDDNGDEDPDGDDQDGNQGGCQSSEATQNNHSNIEDAVTLASDSKINTLPTTEVSQPSPSQSSLQSPEPQRPQSTAENEEDESHEKFNDKNEVDGVNVRDCSDEKEGGGNGDTNDAVFSDDDEGDDLVQEDQGQLETENSDIENEGNDVQTPNESDFDNSEQDKSEADDNENNQSDSEMDTDQPSAVESPRAAIPADNERSALLPSSPLPFSSSMPLSTSSNQISAEVPSPLTADDRVDNDDDDHSDQVEQNELATTSAKLATSDGIEVPIDNETEMKNVDHGLNNNSFELSNIDDCGDIFAQDNQSDSKMNTSSTESSGAVIPADNERLAFTHPPPMPNLPPMQISTSHQPLTGILTSPEIAEILGTNDHFENDQKNPQSENHDDDNHGAEFGENTSNESDFDDQVVHDNQSDTDQPFSTVESFSSVVPADNKRLASINSSPFPFLSSMPPSISSYQPLVEVPTSPAAAGQIDNDDEVKLHNLQPMAVSADSSSANETTEAYDNICTTNSQDSSKHFQFNAPLSGHVLIIGNVVNVDLVQNTLPTSAESQQFPQYSSKPQLQQSTDEENEEGAEKLEEENKEHEDEVNSDNKDDKGNGASDHDAKSDDGDHGDHNNSESESHPGDHKADSGDKALSESDFDDEVAQDDQSDSKMDSDQPSAEESPSAAIPANNKQLASIHSSLSSMPPSISSYHPLAVVPTSPTVADQDNNDDDNRSDQIESNELATASTTLATSDGNEVSNDNETEIKDFDNGQNNSLGQNDTALADDQVQNNGDHADVNLVYNTMPTQESSQQPSQQYPEPQSPQSTESTDEEEDEEDDKEMEDEDEEEENDDHDDHSDGGNEEGDGADDNNADFEDGDQSDDSNAHSESHDADDRNNHPGDNASNESDCDEKANQAESEMDTEQSATTAESSANKTNEPPASIDSLPLPFCQILRPFPKRTMKTRQRKMPLLLLRLCLPSRALKQWRQMEQRLMNKSKKLIHPLMLTSPQPFQWTMTILL